MVITAVTTWITLFAGTSKRILKKLRLAKGWR
jgi:hypothetical protein